MSLLTENKALKKASQVEQLSQQRAISIISYINQETSTTSALAIEEISAFSTLKSE